MGWYEKIKSVFMDSSRVHIGPDESEIEIIIPKSLYIRELAIYTATSLIANAISQSEIKVYQGGKAVKNEEYFSLNIKPNPNESASAFWQKVLEKMLRASPGKGALCFISGKNLYCADDYSIVEKRPFLGNIYGGISIDQYLIDRNFTSDQCFIFRLENTQANHLIKQMYDDYGKIVSKAMEAYKASNSTKFKLKVKGAKAGDPEFNETFEKVLKQPIQQVTNGEKKVYIEYEGYELEPMKIDGSQKNSDDVVKLIDQIFKITGKAYKIPESLMLGNITNMNDVIKSFLTFAVDPVADMISKTLTGQYGLDNWINGNYYKVDTSGVNHVDIFDMANNIDKLISSAFMCIDEVRERTGMDIIDEEWSSKHVLTKNYEFMEKMMKEVKEGGNSSEENTDDGGRD